MRISFYLWECVLVDEAVAVKRCGLALADRRGVAGEVGTDVPRGELHDDDGREDEDRLEHVHFQVLLKALG